jgi:hypothetical protein
MLCLTTGPETTNPAEQELKSLKLWAKINLSYFKLTQDWLTLCHCSRSSIVRKPPLHDTRRFYYAVQGKLSKLFPLCDKLTHPFCVQYKHMNLTLKNSPLRSAYHTHCFLFLKFMEWLFEYILWFSFAVSSTVDKLSFKFEIKQKRKKNQ